MKNKKNKECLGPTMSGSQCALLNFMSNWTSSVISEDDLPIGQQIHYMLEFDEDTTENPIIHVLLPIDNDINSFHAVTQALDINIAADGQLVDDLTYFNKIYGDDRYNPFETNDGQVTKNVYLPVEYRCMFKDQRVIDIMPALDAKSAQRVAELIYPATIGSSWFVRNSSLEPEDYVEEVTLDVCIHILPDIAYSYDIEEASAIFGEKEIASYLNMKFLSLRAEAEEIEDYISSWYSPIASASEEQEETLWEELDTYTLAKYNNDATVYEETTNNELPTEEIEITEDNDIVIKETINPEEEITIN